MMIKTDVTKAAWTAPALKELSVAETLTSTNFGVLETLTHAGYSGYCCS